MGRRPQGGPEDPDPRQPGPAAPQHLRLPVGGGLKQVNLVIFFWKVDSISIKGTYSGYKNEKPKKMCFNPPHMTLSFWKNLQVSENFCRAQKIKFLKCPEKNSVRFFVLKFFERFLSPSKDDLQKVVFTWT